MKKFCKTIREHATTIINFQKKKMLPLTSKDYKTYLKNFLSNISTVCITQTYFPVLKGVRSCTQFVYHEKSK